MQKKYEQIVSWVRAEIESGAIRQGDRLPSENVLAKQFQVSRQTIRRAMEALTMDGIVEGRRRHICVGKHPEIYGEGDPYRSDADLCGYIYFPGACEGD